jgi:hypothetical protein
MITFEVPIGFKTVSGFYKKDGGEGYASDQAAKIEVRKRQPELATAQIVPFKFWDGSMFGKYSKPTMRFAIIVPLPILVSGFNCGLAAGGESPTHS